MLVHNQINLDKTQTGLRKLNFDEDDLPALIQQKPSKRFVGVFRLGEFFYSDTLVGKDTKLKRWLNKSFGKEPVLLDRFSIDRSVYQLRLYLNNYGFFNSTVDTSVSIRGKKARVLYSISLSKPYQVNKIEYATQDTVLERIILQHSDQSLIKAGQIYNASLMDDERTRIKSLLRNNGYYFFSPEFVFYEVDSAFGNHSLNIYTNIQQAQMAGDTTETIVREINHRKYHINNIAINTEFNPIRSDTSNMDFFRDTVAEDGINRYFFYYRDKLRIRPTIVRNSIFLEPLKLYSERQEESSYRQLSSLALYGYTSLQFKALESQKQGEDTELHYLNALINLTRRPVQSFSVETEGTTSGGRLGMAGNFVYQNLNIFRGAEVLTLKLTGGLEWQQGGTTRNDVLLFFNTVQTGAEISLDFPKFVLPFSIEKMLNVIRPRTTITLGTNYQNRPDYKNYVTNVSFGYSWRKGQFTNHNLTIVDLNSVSIFPDSSFVIRLEELNDPRLTNQYTDHFIMSSKYSYIFNNQERGKVQNFKYFRWSIETAGNFLQMISRLSGSNTNEAGESVIWNIPFAQYVRTDIDFRYYFAIAENNTLVYRNMAGIGLAYNNSEVLPFEKGFYMGGSNDMRGWKYRSLGPGSFLDTSGVYFEKMGDLAFETNLEYRFPVYSYLKGALFTDVGNIWLLNNSENYPGGKFKMNEFLNELAINAGVGFRLDFSFFIFRVDAAAPLKDPSYPKEQRWRVNALQMRDVIWSFGIGYPF